MADIAIIGGTGVYDPEILDDIREEGVATPYGDIFFTIGRYNKKEIVFIPRHGKKHSITPHHVNYRGNVWAVKKIGVSHILSTTAVGSLNLSMKPGDFVFVDQFIDFTKGRDSTFFEGGKRGVVHVDMTEPYCPRLRSVLKKAAEGTGIEAHAKGVYICTEGPRFETPAEIRMFTQWGADLVGMTNVPEVVLAREAEICYATISMVTNFAAGISSQELTHGEVLETMAANRDNFRKLIMKSVEMIEDDKNCFCQRALSEYGKFIAE